MLSPNFSVLEFTRSNTASRLGIDNTLDPAQTAAAQLLCVNVLEQVRTRFGPVHVLSGFRCPALNSAVGGSKTSQHMAGEAADIEVVGVSMLDLFLWIKDNCEFDQLLLEFVQPAVPGSGWVHVSWSAARLRQETLVIDRAGTRPWSP